MNTNTKTIDTYIKQFPDEVQVILKKMRETIRSVVPKAGEAIKYGMPTFILNGNLVHFAAFKNHIGFYPSPGPIVAFKKELAKFNTSKGAIQFPIEKPIPYALVKKIVRFRVKQTIEKFKD
ncbi:MAG: DUF1801 domain-containing protein [Candidatus Doudnabacteria bacterium]|nr:DUF1801 domain-containing protein [Candidatus Doudnabacteria bacterium]